MSFKSFLPLIALVFFSSYSQAQNTPPCGQDLILDHWLGDDPVRMAAFQAYEQERRDKMGQPSTAKTTAQIRIPVVFHVVLPQSMYNSIGQEAGLRKRMESQIDALNRDFNGQNSDKSKVPAVFSSVFGNAEILFAPAHTDPNGNATDGFVVKISPQAGFAIEQSLERRSLYGGLDPWDPGRYLNIWVVNISNSGVLGYALSPGYAGMLNLPMGVTVSYMAFGQKRSFLDGPFFSATDSGRTMVHEMGHFFDLAHIWGNTAMGQGHCNDDDGIHDTPQQKDGNYNCQIFPKPNCTNSPGGEMFMNYMDYVNDACMYMFTKGQVSHMRQQLSPQGPSNTLTQHPELFSYPQNIESIPPEATFSVYPNPSHGEVHVEGPPIWKGQAIHWSLYNYMGQHIQTQQTHWPRQGPISIDMNGLPAGPYYLELQTKESQHQLKILLR